MPLGYRYTAKADGGGKLLADPYEAQAVRRMFDLFLQGLSYNAILKDIQSNFPMPYRGQKNKGSWVASVLQNRIYIGQQYFKGEYYPSDAERIVSEDVFWAVQRELARYQEQLDSNLRKPRHRGHLLTGLIWCGCCGARFCYKDRVYNTKTKGSVVYSKYVCMVKDKRPSECKESVSWKASDLEQAVLSRVQSLRFDELAVDMDTSADELNAIKVRVDAITEKLDKLIDLYTLGTLPLEAIQRRSADYISERDKLVERMRTIQESSSTARLEAFKTAMMNAAGIDTLDEQGQRDVLRSMIRRITVYPGRPVELEWNI